ncbi:MAG: TDP-N-acetylfucosamine:lipid II N-acetylfucosaminyltransferase, partial [Pseudomonadota bacterium]|nr:TDP-N-acetylfucosamine:lipid II N-acetylfucosaminyltransferase [Pseudomonadota bacterium]
MRSLDMAGFARAAATPDIGGVVCHVMTPVHLAALSRIPAHVQAVWLGWGYDYYGLINDAFPDGLLQPATAALGARLAAPSPEASAHCAVPTVLGQSRPYRRPSAAECDALSRVDIFSPVIDTEYHLVRRHVPGFRARYVRWNYGTAEDDFTLQGAARSAPGRNILAGNSATATNNHLELFERIRRTGDLAGRLVVTPLSYGDSSYRACVIEAGRKSFGDAFVPLVDFMPKDSYIELLASCGHVMMNHVRQQALGNLVISGLMGARLHLNRSSPLFNWLRSIEVPAEALDSGTLAPLTTAERDGQVAALGREFGRSAQRARTRALV